MNICPPSLCIQMFAAYGRMNSRANEILFTSGWFMSACIWPADKTAEVASHPSPYLPSYLCSWLPAAPSDAWIKSYHFRSCCCVLESPASLGFGLPVHSLPWHKPASQQKPFPLWAPPLSREGRPLHLIGGGARIAGDASEGPTGTCVLSGKERQDMCPWP